MAYIFKPDHHYRMPTHFGPSLGPRQGPDMRRYDCQNTPDCTFFFASFVTSKAQIETLLPPGFSLREPYIITLSFEYMSNIQWLAGRGYNTFGISVPATFNGDTETVHGNLLLVLWENRADPIITGREDLGFAKIYAELPQFQREGSDIICRASWDGYEFFSLRLSNVKDGPFTELNEPQSSAGMLHYKYIPKTGCLGEADAQYALLTPADNPNEVVHSTYVSDQAEGMFKRSSWEQLPTLVNIVNTMADFSLDDCVAAGGAKVSGGKDLSDQRILR